MDMVGRGGHDEVSFRIRRFCSSLKKCECYTMYKNENYYAFKANSSSGEISSAQMVDTHHPVIFVTSQKLYCQYQYHVSHLVHTL